MHDKQRFLKYLQYDFRKLKDQKQVILDEIEKIERKQFVGVSPEALSSTSWRSQHNDESLEDLQERISKEQERKRSGEIATLKKWLKHGLFERRLTFKNNNKDQTFYITTASVDVNLSFGENDFIIPYWGDNQERVEFLMKTEVGYETEKYGELTVVGDFEAHPDDLKKIRYKDLYGKEEFRSAKDVLDNKVEEKVLDKRIDTNNFFRLKFSLAGIGDQSKALYDTNSSIIDGAAGTGKSTIALQKLKYFHNRFGYSQEKMAVVVKNNQIVEHFRTLLHNDELGLYNVKIFHLDDFLTDLQKSVDLSQLAEAKLRANTIKESISNGLYLFDIEHLQGHFEHLFHSIGKEFISSVLNNLLNNYRNDPSKRNKIENLRIRQTKLNNELLDDTIDETAQLEILDELKRINSDIDKLRGVSYEKALKVVEEDPNKLSIEILKDLMDFQYNKQNERQLQVLHWIKESLNFFISKERAKEQLIKNREKLDKMRDIKDVQDDIVEAKSEYELGRSFSSMDELKSLKDKLDWLKREATLIERLINTNDRLFKKINKSFIPERKEKNLFHTVMTDIYLDHQFLQHHYLMDLSQVDQQLTMNYIHLQQKKYETIVVDEAQDYKLSELELLRFETNRIILTGDVLQNINDGEISDWSDLLNVYDIYGVENTSGDLYLNKFDLKHNFRQTYQLANASFNYRQLLLENALEDIEKEYYESEKQFAGKPYDKPLLKANVDPKMLQEHIAKWLKKISNTYTTSIPIVLVYKSESEKNFFEESLSQYKIVYSVEEETESDIILMNLQEVKGNEFPIIGCYIDDLSDYELYLIMTRAQFELHMMTQSTHIVKGNKLLTLVEHGWISYEVIELETEKSSEVCRDETITNSISNGKQDIVIDDDKRKKLREYNNIDVFFFGSITHERLQEFDYFAITLAKKILYFKVENDRPKFMFVHKYTFDDSLYKNIRNSIDRFNSEFDGKKLYIFGKRYLEQLQGIYYNVPEITDLSSRPINISQHVFRTSFPLEIKQGNIIFAIDLSQSNDYEHLQAYHTDESLIELYEQFLQNGLTQDEYYKLFVKIQNKRMRIRKKLSKKNKVNEDLENKKPLDGYTSDQRLKSSYEESVNVTENIIKHQNDVSEPIESINIENIFDEQKYKDTFVSYLHELESRPETKKTVFIRREIDTANDTLSNEIRQFLYKTYKGHCQICGFTFKKASDQLNSFEKFNWNDKRVIKVKKPFVSSADSLCLCRNCTAVIKFGDFEPSFIKSINDIHNFSSKHFYEIIQVIHNVIDIEIHDIFKDHVDFEDMYALEVRLNNTKKNIFFTREHLMQFITYLQLEYSIELEKLNECI